MSLDTISITATSIALAMFVLVLIADLVMNDQSLSRKLRMTGNVLFIVGGICRLCAIGFFG